MRHFALGVERQKLVGHVLDAICARAFCGVPGGAAELVERRVVAFDDAIVLDQIHALERNVEAGLVGVFEQHEFAAAAVGFDLAQAVELADAVVDVDDEVAGLELGKIAEETGSADFAAGTLNGRGDVEQIGVAKKCDARFGKRDAFGERRANK